LLYYLDTETVVGQTVELAIYRDGQPQTLEVALEARPRPQ
jgi:S1-C subfamily serine protease